MTPQKICAHPLQFYCLGGSIFFVKSGRIAHSGRFSYHDFSKPKGANHVKGKLGDCLLSRDFQLGSHRRLLSKQCERGWGVMSALAQRLRSLLMNVDTMRLTITVRLVWRTLVYLL